MSTGNGYITLDQLAAIPRIQKDFIWGPHKFRLQALLDSETAIVDRLAKREDDPTQMDWLRYQSLMIAYGMAAPALHPNDDLDTALDAISHIPPGVQQGLFLEIRNLTYRKASESWKDFLDEEPSAPGAADGAPSSSNSAKLSAAPIPSS